MGQWNTFLGHGIEENSNSTVETRNQKTKTFKRSNDVFRQPMMPQALVTVNVLAVQYQVWVRYTPLVLYHVLLSTYQTTLLIRRKSFAKKWRKIHNFKRMKGWDTLKRGRWRRWRISCWGQSWRMKDWHMKSWRSTKRQRTSSTQWKHMLNSLKVHYCLLKKLELVPESLRLSMPKWSWMKKPFTPSLEWQLPSLKACFFLSHPSTMIPQMF